MSGALQSGDHGCTYIALPLRNDLLFHIPEIGTL